MIEKLEHFRRACFGVEHNSKPFICKDAIKALDNLEIHILKGCLENIPPKTGTSRNESLHQQLNKIINIPKCSVELIVSVLGSFFYKWNADHSETNATANFPFVPKYEITEMTNIEENNKLQKANENSTSTSILD